jgi:hypothetical protein
MEELLSIFTNIYKCITKDPILSGLAVVIIVAITSKITNAIIVKISNTHLDLIIIDYIKTACGEARHFVARISISIKTRLRSPACLCNRILSEYMWPAASAIRKSGKYIYSGLCALSKGAGFILLGTSLITLLFSTFPISLREDSRKHTDIVENHPQFTETDKIPLPQPEIHLNTKTSEVQEIQKDQQTSNIGQQSPVSSLTEKSEEKNTKSNNNLQRTAPVEIAKAKMPSSSTSKKKKVSKKRVVQKPKERDMEEVESQASDESPDQVLLPCTNIASAGTCSNGIKSIPNTSTTYGRTTQTVSIGTPTNRSRNTRHVANMEYHSDGSYTRHVGNMDYHSDGSYTQHVGNMDYHSDGSYTRHVANMDYHSDGSYTQHVGNMDYHSDGSYTQHVGNMDYHSDGGYNSRTPSRFIGVKSKIPFSR